MDVIFSIEGGLVLSLVVVVLAALSSYLSKKVEANKAQRDDAGGQSPDDDDDDQGLSDEAIDVIEAAKRVIETAKEEPWGTREFEVLQLDAERIWDTAARVKNAQIPPQPAPVPQTPPDPAAGNGQGPGQPGPDPGAANPGAVS